MQIDNDRIRILQQTQLFADFAKGEIPALLRMLRAKEASYSKGSFVLREGARRVPSALSLIHISTAFRLGGERSILLSYRDLY